MGDKEPQPRNQGLSIFNSLFFDNCGTLESIEGFTGETGPRGEGGGTGPQGITGTDGIDGPTGTAISYTGHQGMTGISYQGITGIQGSTGPTGYQSTTFITNVGVTGPEAVIPNVFNTTYDNYKISISNAYHNTIVDDNMYLAFMDGSLGDTGTQYTTTTRINYLTGQTSTATLTAPNKNGADIGFVTNVQPNGWDCELQGVSSTQYTLFEFNSYNCQNNATQFYGTFGYGIHAKANAYTGFMLFSANTFSANVSVMGYTQI